MGSLAYTGHAGLLSVLMTQFMLSIRVAIESLSSVPMVRFLRVGAAREVAMDSSKALVRSRSILRHNRVYVADPTKQPNPGI